MDPKIPLDPNFWMTLLVDLKYTYTECLFVFLGYCGADLKSLCTEASLLALRRRYPQIYTTSEKLQLDVSSINLAAKDFFKAMQCIVPASQRSITSPARALSLRIQPLLRNVFKTCIDTVQKVFPSVFSQLSSLDIPGQYTGVTKYHISYTYHNFLLHLYMYVNFHRLIKSACIILLDVRIRLF